MASDNNEIHYKEKGGKSRQQSILSKYYNACCI